MLTRLRNFQSNGTEAASKKITESQKYKAISKYLRFLPSSTLAAF